MCWHLVNIFALQWFFSKFIWRCNVQALCAIKIVIAGDIMDVVLLFNVGLFWGDWQPDGLESCPWKDVDGEVFKFVRVLSRHAPHLQQLAHIQHQQAISRQFSCLELCFANHAFLYYFNYFVIKKTKIVDSLSYFYVCFYHSYSAKAGGVMTPLTSTWPHLRCDVGLEEGEYRESCLCLAVLCTIIMVHKDASSS